MQLQWLRKSFRLEMLTSPDAWPKHYSIGIPSAADMTAKPDAIRQHVMRWKQVSNGEVAWRDVNYRASSETLSMPAQWILERPSVWVRATAQRSVTADYDLLEFLMGHAEIDLRGALINNLKLLQSRSRQELLAALKLANTLKPREAQGRPLRLLAGHGVDTKFFERNRQLLVRLLDARFDGEVGKQGLHEFLDAASDGEHWLLVVPLQQGLLPFGVQQVRTQELASLAPDVLRAQRILVVENRQCRHLLPNLDNTIAILGSGMDLDWLGAAWLDDKDIVYWGDIDTWGLTMLSRARHYRPNLKSVLMDKATFEKNASGNAVIERVSASDEPPENLNADQKMLYRHLLACEAGRLEQEFVPEKLVHSALEALVISS